MSVPRFIRLFAVGLVVLCTLIPGPMAFANPPSRQPAPFTTLYLTGVCSFDVKAEALFDNAKVTTFYDRAGNVRLQLNTGVGKIRLTNLSTGQSIDSTISAAAHVVTDAAGTSTVTITGTWGGDNSGGAVPGFPNLWFFKGKAVLTIDAVGNIVSVTHTPGPITDMCAALAG